jgi:hypothetical protein
MPIRAAITRVTGQGEQFVVDVCQWNPVTGEIMHADVDEMRTLANDMLQLSDIRMYEMNMRMFEAYGLEKHFDAGTWQKILQLLDILAGRTDIAQVLQRWAATKEENAELEAGRRAAHEASIAVQPRVVGIDEVPETVDMSSETYAVSCGCAVKSDGSINVCEKHS